MKREPIFSALASLLEAVPGIKTFSRRLRHWTDVSATEQPALFLVCSNQSASVEGRGMPTRHSLPAKLYLYVNTKANPKIAPSSLLNDLLDSIEAALAPDAGQEVQTLGGLVSHCWISGEIETDEGVLGDQAMAIVPIDILVP